jgi:hypothetical protein
MKNILLLVLKHKHRTHIAIGSILNSMSHIKLIVDLFDAIDHNGIEHCFKLTEDHIFFQHKLDFLWINFLNCLVRYLIWIIDFNLFFQFLLFLLAILAFLPILIFHCKYAGYSIQ